MNEVTSTEHANNDETAAINHAHDALTEPERQTLAFIVQFKRDSGFAPSVAQMTAHARVTGTAIMGRLKRLERKGYIYRPAKTARAISVLRLPEELVASASTGEHSSAAQP